jgi:omega-6 fatty acid desaturase (delta-12 desaturase)
MPCGPKSEKRPTGLTTANRARTAHVEAYTWTKVLARYREPSDARAILEIVITFAPFVTLWGLAWAALHFGYPWLSLLAIGPAAGFLVRMFMIQHDCGHGSFFRHRQANDWVGRVIGVLTLTPYDYWRRAHALHHATSGRLDRRGYGDIRTLTTEEYRALPLRGRLLYRAYRHPVVMFEIAPAYQFLLAQRLPIGLMRGGWVPWMSAMATNAAIAAIATALIVLVGLGPFLFVQLPIVLIAGSIGVWLFYVQHQFEDTLWERDGEWNVHEAALHGSSHYDLPPVLRWLTANIGMHHVHHLSSRIPFYRLPRVLHDHPELRDIGRLTLLQSFGCVRLVLWDETRRRLVSFREGSARPRL